ncbi:conserved hypothetical protein [Hyphomicrobiales bacterium]|jgi:hypothetical protein|nr:conserved hypothetical protein [Hyphomicrobiales bacterium]CAH1696921.1 conserved hypothetical protein [Hyphomicrobiales bacterium]
MREVIAMRVRVGEAPAIKVIGRVAWTLNELLLAGEEGVTTLGNSALRWSDYVFKLRKKGIVIETIDEKHGGPFSGTHGRYVLRSAVDVLDVTRQGDLRDAA